MAMAIDYAPVASLGKCGMVEGTVSVGEHYGRQGGREVLLSCRLVKDSLTSKLVL
jgi:hypothetical protein